MLTWFFFSRDTPYPNIVARVQAPFVEEKLLFWGIMCLLFKLSPRLECLTAVGTQELSPMKIKIGIRQKIKKMSSSDRIDIFF